MVEAAWLGFVISKQDSLNLSPECRKWQVTTEVCVASNLLSSHSCHDGEELANLKWLVMCPYNVEPLHPLLATLPFAAYDKHDPSFAESCGKTSSGVSDMNETSANRKTGTSVFKVLRR